MRRRRILRGFPGLFVLGGCVGTSNDADAESETGSGDSGTGTDGSGGTGTSGGTVTMDAERREALATLLQEDLERRGLEVRNVRVEEETVVVRAQTTGNVTEDMRIAGGAYATNVDVLNRDLRVEVEDRGLYEARFTIRHEWARRFANGRMSDAAYLERINGTRPARRRAALDPA